LSIAVLRIVVVVWAWGMRRRVRAFAHDATQKPLLQRFSQLYAMRFSSAIRRVRAFAHDATQKPLL